MAKDDGGPAFPGPREDGLLSPGMSLRDWFAGQALAGSVADRDYMGNNSSQDIALDCYLLAEAMVAERAMDHDEEQEAPDVPADSGKPRDRGATHHGSSRLL